MAGFLGPLRVTLYTVAIFGYGLLANVVFLLSALLMPFEPEQAYRANSKTAYILWDWMQNVFYSHGGRITYSGDEIPEGESALVISNHLSYSDYYMIHSVAQKRGMLAYCRYFAKFALLYQLPIFGISLWAIGMVMVKRDWTRDKVQAEQAFSSIKNRKQKVWLISYLEGTRYTHSKVKASHEFANKRDLPILQHVLLPRTRGFVAAVTQLRQSHVKYVYDFTIAYMSPTGKFQVAPTLYEVHANTHLESGWQFHTNVRRFAIADLPQDSDKLAKWVESRFEEKDRTLQNILDNFKKTGQLRLS